MITYFTSYRTDGHYLGKEVGLRTFHCPPHYKVYEEYNPRGPEGEPVIEVFIQIYYDPATPEVIFSPDPFETVVAKICNQIDKLKPTLEVV